MRQLKADFGASLFDPEPVAQWLLPKKLREISGLALTPDGRVMGHNDETAVIHQIDVETGASAKRFSLGEPVLRGDFEGLAIDGGGDFYLASSDGWVRRFREGDDRAAVDFESFDTGLGPVGEVEGLAFHEGQQLLIIACKRLYAPQLQGTLSLFAWSPRAPLSPAALWLSVSLEPLAEAVGARGLHPSSLEIDPVSGRLILLAARENALLELDEAGGLLAARWLGRQHRQAEGATILPDGSLVIADEGGHAQGTLTRYARAHED
ncbi:hypothetical protein ACO2Q3_22085 [Caulobacter sp. KR2-114]|uniref:hypothetical protein n=1 Tax=Caulobacter sp. KR2-114 TaxID=3400912 RepID=UPI003C0649BE